MNTQAILKSSKEVNFPWNKTKVKIVQITHTILNDEGAIVEEVCEWLDSFGQSYFSIDELKAGLVAHSSYVLVGVTTQKFYRASEFSTAQHTQVVQMWYNNKHSETHFWASGMNCQYSLQKYSDVVEIH